MFAASKTASVSGGYQISRSLRFNSADSAYLNRTPASAGNRQTFTFSAWVKRSALSTATFNMFGGGASATNFTEIYFSAQDDLRFYDYASSTSVYSSSVYRDVSAWYHIVYAIDTTQATASNRVKIYVNGTQLTSFATANYPAQNANMYINTAGIHSLGALNYTASVVDYFNGYMTEINFIDGQALTPSSFGETNAQTGVWQPKAYSGSYGTNGFYLNFSDNSNTTAATLGKDYSGNGNNWTPNNFSVTAGAGNDSLVDSPTSYGVDTGVGGTVRGNYCTLNPLATFYGKVLVNGNLDFTSSISAWSFSLGTIGFSSGKYYWEVNMGSSNGSDIFAGIMGSGIPTSVAGNLQDNVSVLNQFGSLLFCDDGKYQLDGNTGRVAYSTALASNQTLGIAVDMDGKSLTFYKDGVSQGAISFSASPMASSFVSPAFTSYYTADSPRVFNFGQRPFAYTAPSGFKALCTQNLPTPTIGATTATQAGEFFNPVLYTGNGATSRSITGVGFQPDFVWFKARSTAYGHALFNSVVGANKFLSSNNTDAEVANYAFGYLSSFDADGFSLTGGSSNNGYLNENNTTYVAWNWKANGSGSTNTAGSITSTVSANTTSGFSVVTWTGNGADASIGHGLGVVPSMVIQKFRSAVSNWSVYTSTTGAGKRLKLNSTDAVVTDGSFPTTPTSSVFYINGGSNDNGVTMVAYCFAEVAGYSKFGKYTGNGSTDGPFVYTGFRPAFVLFKRTDATSDWWMYDTKRSPSNEIQIILWPNYSDAEATGASIAIDILSNGFKPRSNNATFNGSGGTYIFMAFAESPQKFSLAR